MPALKAQKVNLTPWPQSITVFAGNFKLPDNVTIDASAVETIAAEEAARLATELQAATGRSVSVAASSAPTIKLIAGDENMDEEGYNLRVKSKSIEITARTEVGFFYAFQSLKKMLPANVAAGVAADVTSYSLPCLQIQDAPRFRYRGFMLDVSRHFFTTDEIKKILRLMALYKMNVFHWHLTDDQGWRVEIKKYPKLTTVAATRNNSWNTDMDKGQYWTNQTYGPYFYTQEEVKDIVAYAAKLHITVVPEVEMPGHFAAALTAYPEFSCNPSGSHSVWVNGGISTDVLNVANTAAVQFAKDILSELAPLFPSKTFHIGGDETPTTAWQNNKECQDLYKAEGMTAYYQLQSRFTKEIAAHLKTLGKDIGVWNEAITANGADVSMIAETGATVYCWNPCQAGAKLAAQNGLKAIITNWGQDGCYYINRRANSTDYGAGNGGDNLQKTYEYVPLPASIDANLQKYFYGVQASFWTEHVSEPEHLEHLAIPRLMAVAEAGWTPQDSKDFGQFVNRMKQDREFFSLAGYRYHPQFLDYEGAEAPVPTTPLPEVSEVGGKRYYYRISSLATTGERSGRCIELLQEGSPLIAANSSRGAAANVLWTNSAKENAENQLWAIEANKNYPGKYALVSLSKPEGSLNPTASAAGTTGRWSYSDSQKHYNFIIGDNASGEDGGAYYYTIRSDKYDALWMNCAMFYGVNLYANPTDGQGGYWKFEPVDVTRISPLANRAEKTGKTYDLQGRRIDEPTAKGIYIVNGQKVLY